ncbi:threonine/serine ThrE exporter family protein [Shewanella aestuarii]|uniref:Threonine/serine exporter family protein n=1 Tax=Shewanella aestuarii TaxID=1028752 RepID=A0A6G9QLY7_9GAMM|nr:threonine/serine exporter family protein [Shewanella aestuarii]QIR15057.1 threonine/serine exporter family protein [Shewanella aestuarii]
MKTKTDTKSLGVPSVVSFDEAWHFIVKVGLAFHRYGSTAGRLEFFLRQLSEKFGYEGVFKSTPSEIIFGLRETPNSPQRLEFITTPGSGVDLDKLAQLGDLLTEFDAGHLSLDDFHARLNSIDKTPPPWGPFATLLSYAIVGAGLAPLLGGGWADSIFATLFSILVYGVVVVSGRLGPVASSWLPFSSAFIVGVLATVVKLWVPELNLVLVILSAVAIIIPGYTISLGVGELVGQHIASGIANLMAGLICLSKQVLGGWFGIIVVSKVFPMVTSEPSVPVAQIWMWLFVPLILIGLCLAFQTSRRDLLWAVLVSGIAYLGIMLGSVFLNTNLGNLLGTIFAVVLANLWAEKTGRPGLIVLIPAIVLLVSGSIGFRGLIAMVDGNLLLGVEQFLQMFVVALTIFVGIIIGYTISRPNRWL